jgi:hypothetical protein
MNQNVIRFIESQDIPETENTLGLDGGETKFYVYIQSTTMEKPDLEIRMLFSSSPPTPN